MAPRKCLSAIVLAVLAVSSHAAPTGTQSSSTSPTIPAHTLARPTARSVPSNDDAFAVVWEGAEPLPFAGHTATGRAPNLAQVNPAFHSLAGNGGPAPMMPIQTAMAIAGAPLNGQGESIFQNMGQLSPYRPNAEGFGVDEYPLPEGAEIIQVQMVHRHGSRYPSHHHAVNKLGKTLKHLASKAQTHFSGSLSFLNSWEFGLGGDIMVPLGRQELFDSGVLHQYLYGNLWAQEVAEGKGKMVMRTTTQDRMRKSAENFAAGFFGLDWNKYAKIEYIIEKKHFNNSLAGYKSCDNAINKHNDAYVKVTDEWITHYLTDATQRFDSMTSGGDFAWSPHDVYAAQQMCAFETVAHGYSPFCALFSFAEWTAFEYAADLHTSGTSSFHSPLGRAVGLGYIQEVVARLEHQLPAYGPSNLNSVLDGNEETFPLDQRLYFDFSHDSNIISILTAFGLTQLAGPLPSDHYPGPHPFTLSHLTPFGARLDIEIITTPQPLSPTRQYEGEGKGGEGETRYVHFVLNQRTVPLGRSHPECGDRVDGWCELDAFIAVMKRQFEKARFEYACSGKYEKASFASVTDGAPVS